MSEIIQDQLIINKGDKNIISLDATEGKGNLTIINSADGKPLVTLHQYLRSGQISVLDDTGHEISKIGNVMGGGYLYLADDQKSSIYLSAGYGTISIRNDKAQDVVQLNRNGDLLLGGYGEDGTIVLNSKEGKPVIMFNSTNGVIHLLGKDGKPVAEITSDNLQKGKITLFHADGKMGSVLSTGGFDVLNAAGKKAASYGATDITSGGGGSAGTITLLNGADKPTILIDASTPSASESGKIVIMDKQKNVTKIEGGRIELGGNGRPGRIYFTSADNQRKIKIDSEILTMTLGDNLKINPDGITGIGNITLGGGGRNGNILIQNKDNKTTINLDGLEGDVKLLGADCAEDFTVVENALPGSVMVINEEGLLERCSSAYDKKVAGVISGAGNFAPGIRLGNKPGDNEKIKPLALVGKVFCMVDADFAQIEVGDLLTTSTTKGHAMKAGQAKKSFGCIIGKALQPLGKGKGLIPILVTLQ